MQLAFANFWTRVQSRYIRSSANLFCKRPMAMNTQVPFISFTFDDFPRSALHTGGAILGRYGLTGTYYASFGLMGKQSPTGTMFLREDLAVLLEQGHELGCHTFGHCHAWNTEPKAFEQSLIRNEEALRELAPGVSFKTMSYPISPPRPQTKQKTARHFAGCRGGGQTFNVGAADLNYLSAYFLEKTRDNPSLVKNLIERNGHAKGWLILATHDISNNPTPYGCTPRFFEDIVQSALNSGARVLPVVQALEALRANPRG
jgi:peptidoglycan/xylan/chitin deacetylase (PgdA/CDA1 family)